MARNPNPQPISFSRWEAVTLTVTMRPALSDPWPGSATFLLNIRDPADSVVVQSAAYLVVDADTGVVSFPLTSDQTGAIESGDYSYDIWRTDAGCENRLVWGSLSELTEQWK